MWFNLVGAIYFGVFQIPNKGTIWMNYILPSVTLGSLPLILLVKEVQQGWSQCQPKDRIFFSLLSQIPSTSFKSKIYMISSWMLPQNFKSKFFFTTSTTTQIYIQNFTIQYSSHASIFHTTTFFHSSSLYLS